VPTASETDRAIRASGLRRTTPRSVVSAVLHGHPGHHTVGEIQEFLEVEFPAIAIARSSVYRALEALEGAGLVVTVRGGQEETRFEWAGTPHHHLICDDCGHTAEVRLDVARQIEREVRQTFNFETRVRHLALRGRCSHCRAERSMAPSSTSEDSEEGSTRT